MATPIFDHAHFLGAKFPTFATKVVGSWDKADNMYFDELSNFVEQTFFVSRLVFEIIEIIT